MRILFVTGGFPSISETFIVNQITYLIDAGHDVQIHSFSRGSTAVIHQAIRDYELLQKCTWYERPSPRFYLRFLQLLRILKKALKHPDWHVIINSFNVFKYGRRVLNLSLPFEAQWFFEKRKFDVIHVHFGDNAIPVAALFSKGIVNKTPLVVSFHGYDLAPDELSNLKELYSSMFSCCDAFTVNSQYTKDLLTRIYHKDNVYILPEGLETGKFTQGKTDMTNKERGEFTLVFCGRLIHWKAPDIAIEIVKELVTVRKHANVRLKIIGDGPIRESLNAQIANGQLQNHVDMLGALTQEQIIRELGKADVFLFPGRHDPKTQRAENQGLVIQEAQSMRLPAIVSDAGGMKYGVHDGVTGFVVKENDVKGFADKIVLLLNSDDLRMKMGVEGRKFVKDKFDMNVLGPQLIAIYHDCLGNPS